MIFYPRFFDCAGRGARLNAICAACALVLPAMVAAADIRVYSDPATFFAETDAFEIAGDYPFFRGEGTTVGSVRFKNQSDRLIFNEWTSAFDGFELAISGTEDFDMTFAAPYLHAVGFEVIEPVGDDFVDSTFEITVYGIADAAPSTDVFELHRETINFPDDEPAFLGFSAERRIVALAVREIVGTDDNEYFGRVFGSFDRPGAIAAGSQMRVQEFNRRAGLPAFERVFRFSQLPDGAYRRARDSGIEVIASGDTLWSHVEFSPLGLGAARQADASEQWTISLPPGTHAIAFDFFESSVPGGDADSCFHPDCSDTLYRLQAWNGMTPLRDQRLSAWNDRVSRFALWSSVPIDRVDLQALFNAEDDELLGRIRAGSTPLPPAFPRRIASVDGVEFGRQVAVHGGSAVVSDRGGWSIWQQGSDGAWNRSGWRASDLEIEEVALDAAHVVVAGRVGNGARLDIFPRSAGSPAEWPAPQSFALPFADRDVAVDGDTIALGLDGEVQLYERSGAGDWQMAGTVRPAARGFDAFGKALGLDGNLLVVGAGNDTFHVYRRNDAGDFVEVFHQDEFVSPGTSWVDVSGNRIVQQGHAGEIRVFEPDAAGGWTRTARLSAPLPFSETAALGDGVELDGDALVALKSVFDEEDREFRQAVEVWQRAGGRRWLRAYVLADPHEAGPRSANLGGLGSALSISGDAFWLGQSGSPWCEGANDFFGDSGTPDYRPADCGDASGAAFVGSLRAIDAPFFIDGFEALTPD